MLLDRDIPVVVASFGESDDPRLGVIDHDDPKAMEAVVDHLYDLGHRRLAFVSHHLREQSGERRRVGFETALARPGLVAVGLGDGATAVACHNDMLAIATIDRASSGSGCGSPKDISVVGYDDIPLAAHHRIKLTTVQSVAGQMGRRAVARVLGAAREARHGAHREIQPARLIVRSTTTRVAA